MRSIKMLLAAGTLGVAIAATPSLSSANLVDNGSFESSPELTQAGGGWGYFNPTDVDGWDSNTNNIEFWADGFNGVNAYHGEQFAEINAHPSTSGPGFTLFQDLDTVINQTYELTFAYRARQGNESFQVQIGDLDNTLSNHTTNGWTVFTGTFTALSDTTRLMFTSLVPADGTLGNFIDDVSVTAVPEPGTLALLGLGLAGIGLSRRKQAA